MSDKPMDKLDPVDRQLRGMYRCGPDSEGTQVVIHKVCGFEMFNTRPYHNYETWGDGYEACDGKFYATAEDLDDCIKLLAHYRSIEDPSPLPAWKRGLAPPAVAARFGFKAKEDIK